MRVRKKAPRLTKPRLPTFEEAVARFVYDRETGVITHRIDIGGERAGAVAGRCCHKGYRRLAYYGKGLLAHRLAWLLVTGEWPAGDIDHINGIPSDNRFANLRQCSRAQNLANVSGRKGAFFNTQCQRWRAQIRINGKQKHLGAFDTEEQARNAYIAAAKEARGEFYCEPGPLRRSIPLGLRD